MRRSGSPKNIKRPKVKESDLLDACLNPTVDQGISQKLGEILSRFGKVDEYKKRVEQHRKYIEAMLLDQELDFRVQLQTCMKHSERMTKEVLRDLNDRIMGPKEHRKEIWLQVSRVEQEKKGNDKDYYKNLLKCRTFPQRYEEVISMDVKRTSATPAQKQILINILTAYSRRNMSIGYLQGMNSMAKLILNIIEDEEDTFWVLVYFCENILETNYLNSMEGVITDQTVLQKILKRRFPNFMDHLQEVGFSLSSITFKWFICLYTICPIKEELKISIWDFLILGDKMTIFKTAFIFIEQIMEAVFNLNDMDSILELMDKDLGMYVKLSGAELAELIHGMYFSEEMVSLIKLYTVHDIRTNLEKEKVKMIPKKADKCDPDFLICQEFYVSQDRETDDFFVLQTSKPLGNRINSY